MARLLLARRNISFRFTVFELIMPTHLLPAHYFLSLGAMPLPFKCIHARAMLPLRRPREKVRPLFHFFKELTANKK